MVFFVGVIVFNLDRENIFIIGLGIFIIVYLCYKLLSVGYSNVACIVYLAIVLKTHAELSAIEYGVYRFIDTFIGVSIASVVVFILLNETSEKHNLKNKLDH